MKKKHFIFIIQNNNKNKKHIKIKKLKVKKKKLKHEPSLKKPGDFTVAEGHEHPLVRMKESCVLGGRGERGGEGEISSMSGVSCSLCCRGEKVVENWQK